ncbi:MAG: RES family NAD+ phosphorylase [Acidobacteriota bacterium]|nr:MAG: RES family NAD+ phosphorylase [Acidobacteriota bacterium]
MILYRITKAVYARDLSGTGARMYGARWNQKGTAVLYTASSPALATVDLLVHVDANLLPSDLRLAFIEVPDNASSRTLHAESLPQNWRAFPAPATLAELGTSWAESRQTLMLRVPSAVVVDDYNVLLSPAHPEFASVRIDKDTAYGFDERLLKRHK